MYGGDCYGTGIEELNEWEYAKGIEPEYALKGSRLVYDSYVEPVEYRKGDNSNGREY